jgi:uncharacterized damage-inducible protein DinB
MTTPTDHLITLWIASRTRLENQLDVITAYDLKKKLAPSPNSVGYVLQHIAEVELLFAKNVFGKKDIKIIAHTVIAKKDTGEWTDLEKTRSILNLSRNTLMNILYMQEEEDWGKKIVTKEFGTKTKAQALGRIVSHTAYHAGQLGILLKYGAVAH